MKIWHKILLSPAIAILFLAMFGGLTYVVVSKQNTTMQELAESSLADVTAASAAAQEMAEVHSSVYRLFTWITNLNEEKVKQAVAGIGSRVASVASTLAKRSRDAGISSEERALL
ncbi:MAG TPA: MCP four helix bundle domain-containing protein, partial [Ramlibacter sp.]|nr:MCP four helix bundle domain-containing protein [Ramlibacter sp.]